MRVNPREYVISPESVTRMNLTQIFSSKPFSISIEIFPPKNADGDEALFQTLSELTPYQPAFISCTYGAGGTTQARTVDLSQKIQSTYGIPVMSHLTCVGSTRDELLVWISHAQSVGIQNIMALRGDAPKGMTSFQRVEHGLGNANELVALIRENFSQMGIGVAAYPEKHPEAQCHHSDLRFLKQKVDAGADAMFTQLFFDNTNYLRFQQTCRTEGIHVPMIPGIMPITEFGRIKRITAMCGAKIPEGLARQLEDVKDDEQAQFEIGVSFAIDQCRELIEEGVPGIHFYALNKSQACQRILGELGLATNVLS